MACCKLEGFRNHYIVCPSCLRFWGFSLPSAFVYLHSFKLFPAFFHFTFRYFLKYGSNSLKFFKIFKDSPYVHALFSNFQVCEMSSEFKVDVISHDFEESGLSSLNGEVTLAERVNEVYEVLNDNRKQGNGSISNIVTNTERRAFSDR